MYASESWVCVSFGGDVKLNLISVYAPNSPRERAFVWNEIAGFSGDTLLCGDFNMFENSVDRFQGLGYVLQGIEEVDWLDMSCCLDIVDVSQDSGFTWTNKQAGNDFRSARLDRFYASDSLVNRWPIFKSMVDRTTQISDHSPLIFQASSSDQIIRSGWFHADPSFFRYPEVKADVTQIFGDSLESLSSPSKTWAQAVSLIQSRLAIYMKKAKEKGELGGILLRLRLRILRLILF